MSESSLRTLSPAEAAEIEKLVAGYETGIALVPQPYGTDATTSLHSEAGDFAKWLKQTTANIDVHMPKEQQPRVLLRSNDHWLPLI